MEDRIEIGHALFPCVCVFVKEFNRTFHTYLNIYLTISANVHLTHIRCGWGGVMCGSCLQSCQSTSD